MRQFGPKDMGQTLPCQCGGGCGLSFVRERRQRCRKYAKDCPVIKERWKTSAKASYRAKHGDPKPRGGRVAEPYTPRSHCKSCFDLAHRRPLTGCKRCGLSHSDEAPMTLEQATIRYADSSFLRHRP